MTRETLRVTWKFIRRSGYKSTRTPNTYCSYIIENENHKHKLKTYEGTQLFDILKETTITKNNISEFEVLVDGIYLNDKLVYVTNFRKV